MFNKLSSNSDLPLFYPLPFWVWWCCDRKMKQHIWQDKSWSYLSFFILPG